MVAILEKSEHNVNFHPIVDFVEASPLRYALTVKPTVYVSHIRQFWSTARIETMEEGTKIPSTVDGILRTVTESSLKRNLKLQDEEGIRFNEFSSNIATALVCLATNRTYNFSKMIFDGMVKNVNNKVFKFLMYPSPSFSGRIAPLFDTMLVPQGKGSGTPSEPHHTPSPEAQHTSYTTHSSPTLPPVTTAPIPSVTQSDTPTLSQGEACPTDSDFEADQDRATIAKTSKTSTLPHNSAPKVTSPAAAEGSMQQTLNELTAFCTSIQRQHSELISKFEAQELEINRLKSRVKLLEDREGVAAERSGDDAPINGRNLDEGEAAAERVSDDTEEMATVLTSMDASTVLASGVAEVSTGSGSIPTVGPPAAEVPTAGLNFATTTVVTPYTRRKGKETMVESETPKKKKIQKQMDIQMARQLKEEMEKDAQRMNEQIARDAEIAIIHVEEELQIMIDGLDRKLPLERRIELISALVRYQDNYAKDFRGMTFEEIEAKFTIVWKQLEDFILMGSKKEAERLKRKGLSLEQKSVKKLKTSEEVPEEAKSPDEVPEEKVKEMMQLVPIEEKPFKSNILLLTGRFTLRDREVIGRSQDDEDRLWTHTQNLMHAPVEWKMYDTCGVHRVIAKYKEIFMLVEKDYPLRKGLAIGMIRYKLQVKNYSKMANDLILKIYKIASSPRQQVIEFPLPVEAPTASEESCHCQKKREATAEKIALLLMSRRNCQSNSDDSYAKSCSNEHQSYARAMIELRADVELKDNINVDASFPSTTHVVEKFYKIKKLIIEGKVTLMDDEGKPLENIASSYEYDSEDEVASVENDMANFLAKKDGYGTQSLLEQWTESYENGDYEYDPYDDDMYEGQDILDKLQAICDKLDITVRGRREK
nr:hypothetical protein [Tanacetum cinerariifolium]